MYIPQDSSNNSIDINSVLSSPSAGFALDSTLDAELSLHNVTSESWSQPNSGALFTNPYAYQQQQQQQQQNTGGSPTTSTAVATPTTELNIPFTTDGPTSHPAINSSGINTPTVVLRRPSVETTSGGGKFDYLSSSSAEGTPTTTTPTTTATANSTTPSPLRDFGNLALNFQQQRGALSIDGPVCLMNGDTVEYVDHLLPVSPGGSSCGLSTPNSPIYEFSPSPSFDNLDNSRNSGLGQDYLQMSSWENSASLSPTSSPPPMGLDLQQQQQKEQDWLPEPNQYQQLQQNLATFTDPSMTSFTGGGFDQTQPEQQQQQQQQQQQPTHRRSAHNAVEKKYRNNINDRIAELKEAVPALRHARVKKDPTHDDNEDEDSDEPVFMDGVAVATKLNKATILQKATEYVFHLQHVNKELKQDVDALLNTIAAHVPNGQDLAQQYRQHVLQRDALQQQQLLYREKMKRHKKPGPSHHQHHQHHSPVKGENRSLNQQYPHFLYLQQQQ